MSVHLRLSAAEVRYLSALPLVSHDRGAREFVRTTEVPPYLIEAGLVQPGPTFPTGLPRLTPAGDAWYDAVAHRSMAEYVRAVRKSERRR